jgi:hypothetical protein
VYYRLIRHREQITPLPEPEKPAYLRASIEDALAKGARIVNARGGKQDRCVFLNMS